jgi:hypothetical protein
MYFNFYMSYKILQITFSEQDMNERFQPIILLTTTFFAFIPSCSLKLQKCPLQEFSSMKHFNKTQYIHLYLFLT